MRIMALDHGTVRVGVALSDELKMIAHPLEFIPAEPPEELFARVQALVKEKDVELVLVGMPRNMDGSYGPAAQKVEAFVAELRTKLVAPVKTVDERLSSVQAQRLLAQAGVKARQQKGKVDQLAAAILLQSHLDQFTS